MTNWNMDSLWIQGFVCSFRSVSGSWLKPKLHAAQILAYLDPPGKTLILEEKLTRMVHGLEE